MTLKSIIEKKTIKTNIFLLIIIFGFPGCKINFFGNPKVTIAEITVERISELYSELGPRIGAHLVEPNAVITLAGLRGYGNLLVHNVIDDERNKIEKASEKLKKSGIQFIIASDTTTNLTEIIIVNLKGLEYSSKLSKLPFVPQFDASTGYDGYKKWLQEVRHQAESFFENKVCNQKRSSLGNPLDHLLIGLQLGYPDQALLDLYQNFGNSQEKPLITSHIAAADYYSNPEPNFQYLPEHESEKSIAKIKESWGTLLQEFYNSHWHKALQKDPIFIKTRKSEDEDHKNWLSNQIS